jgi:hypothetical protein
VQNYLDVRFMGAGVADFGGGGHIGYIIVRLPLRM